MVHRVATSGTTSDSEWYNELWLLKWCKIQSFLLCVFSLILFIFSHLFCIQFLILFVFSLILSIFSQIIYIQPHLIFIQWTYMYSVSSFLYSVNLNVFSHMLYLLTSHLVCVNMFNVLCVTLRNLIKICSFLKRSERMSYRTIFHKETKQTKILSKRKILF